MQASKIKLSGVVYALMHPTDGLVRFKPTKITTTRVNDGFNHQSVVYGHISKSDLIEDQVESVGTLKGPFDVDLVKGDYREYTELVERQNAERAASKAAEEAREAKQTATFAALSKFVPEGGLDTTFGNRVAIESKGQDAVLNMAGFIERLATWDATTDSWYSLFEAARNEARKLIGHPECDPVRQTVFTPHG